MSWNPLSKLSSAMRGRQQRQREIDERRRLNSQPLPRTRIGRAVHKDGGSESFVYYDFGESGGSCDGGDSDGEDCD